jgi:hypothetical protein
MSSPKAARAQRRPKAAARPAAKPSPNLAAVATVTDQANELAATLERALADGKSDAIAPEALQTLLAALCKTYSAQLETDPGLLPVAARSVNSTDVMVTASGLLKSSNLAVFELGMWQSWSGR